MTDAVVWRDNVPVSTQFDDVYYSVQNGLQESRFVFLDGNQLPQRWQQKTQHTILETGFGTGLNFAATVQQWLETASNKQQKLHFVSIEKYPLNTDQIQQALGHWPELATICSALCEQLPPSVNGWHHLNFEQWDLSLTLIYEDITTALAQLAATDIRADSIFLDGFAPAKNPEMWSDQIMNALGNIAAIDATLATFTAVGRVRRALIASGFTMRKTSGYGTKREMLVGDFQHNAYQTIPAWHRTESTPKPKRVAVIGAGIAGSQIAFRLAQENMDIDVYEGAEHIAAGASGNPQGIVFLKLSASQGDLADFNLAAYLHACRFYDTQFAKLATKEDYQQCGILSLCDYALWQKLKDKYQDSGSWIEFLSPEQATVKAQTHIEKHAVWLPQGQWLKPSSLCAHLLNKPNIRLKLSSQVNAVTPVNGKWQVELLNHHEHYDAVVIASAVQSQNFASTYKLPIRPAAGQITAFNANDAKTTPATIICDKGYIAPSSQTVTLGASFRMNSSDTSVLESDHQQNFQEIREAMPDFTEPTTFWGRASVRTASNDYLPLVGPMPSFDRFCQQFSAFKHNAKATTHEEGPVQQGLYVFTGLGSKGLTYSPLCADILCDLICNKGLQHAPHLPPLLHPARFIIRALKRNTEDQLHV